MGAWHRYSCRIPPEGDRLPRSEAVHQGIEPEEVMEKTLAQCQGNLENAIRSQLNVIEGNFEEFLLVTEDIWNRTSLGKDKNRQISSSYNNNRTPFYNNQSNQHKPQETLYQSRDNREVKRFDKKDLTKSSTTAQAGSRQQQQDNKNWKNKERITCHNCHHEKKIRTCQRVSPFELVWNQTRICLEFNMNWPRMQNELALDLSRTSSQPKWADWADSFWTHSMLLQNP